MSNSATPSRRTETRHSKSGKTCHHFDFHRLTCDEYDALRARAAGHCEICGTPEVETGGKRLVVDHFQGGGVRIVRGLICDRCNAVMSCMDGTKNWGANRKWEAKAREYEANSWHLPTPEQRARMASERERRQGRRRFLLVQQD